MAANLAGNWLCFGVDKEGGGRKREALLTGWGVLRFERQRHDVYFVMLDFVVLR